MNYLNLDESILTKIGIKGSEFASNALSRLIMQEVSANDTTTNFVKPAKFIEDELNVEHDVVTIKLGISGDIYGESFLILHDDSAKKIAQIADPNAGDKLSESDLSMLKELGNIFVGAYLNSISDATDLTILPDLPKIEIANPSELKNKILDSLSLNPVSETITIKTNITIKDVNVTATFFILFLSSAVEKNKDRLKE